MQNFFYICLIYQIGASMLCPSGEQLVSDMIHDSGNEDHSSNISHDYEEIFFKQRSCTSQEQSQSSFAIELESIVETDESGNSTLLSEKTMVNHESTKISEKQRLIWKFLVWNNGLLLLFLLVLFIFAIFTVAYILVEKKDYLTGFLIMIFILCITILAMYLGWNIEKSTGGK